MDTRSGDRFSCSGQGRELEDRCSRPSPDGLSEALPVRQAAPFEGTEPGCILPARCKAVEGCRQKSCALQGPVVLGVDVAGQSGRRDGAHVGSRSRASSAMWVKFSEYSRRLTRDGAVADVIIGAVGGLEKCVLPRWGRGQAQTNCVTTSGVGESPEPEQPQFDPETP